MAVFVVIDAATKLAFVIILPGCLNDASKSVNIMRKQGGGNKCLLFAPGIGALNSGADSRWCTEFRLDFTMAVGLQCFLNDQMLKHVRQLVAAGAGILTNMGRCLWHDGT